LLVETKIKEAVEPINSKVTDLNTKIVSSEGTIE
jgi:hypothetical protein